VAIEVYAGNTADPVTLADQIHKVRARFGLARGGVRLRPGDAPGDADERAHRCGAPPGRGAGLGLGAAQRRHRPAGARLAEIRHPDFPGERLIACLNPLLCEERQHRR